MLRAVSVVGRMTLLSRAAGVAREWLLARIFGTATEFSAFVVAFQIPNLFRALFGEGALSAAFVPVYTETLVREGPEEANRLVARVAGLLVAVLGGVTALGILLALALQHWWFPAGSRWAEILPLLRIMLPYAPLICLAALAMGALNALRHFSMPALAPVFLNLINIAALALVCPFLPDDAGLRIRVLSWSVVAAGVVQVAVQLPALARRGVRLRLRCDWRPDARVRRILGLMAPMMLGVGVFQINVVVDQFIAMWAAPWAPAALRFADLVAYLPQGLIGTAFGTVLLAAFSRQAAAGDIAGMAATLERNLRHAWLIVAPAAVALTVLALPVVRFLYLWPGGRFDEQDAVWTMRALAGLAPGLLFFCLWKVLTPAFYALKDTRTPLRVALCGVGLNLGLNVLFVITWPPGWKHVGLAVSTVIVSGLNGVTLARELRRRIGAPRRDALAPAVFGIAAAMLAMGVATWETHIWFGEALRHAVRAAKVAEFLALAGAGTCGLLVYLAVIRLLHPAALRQAIEDLLHRRR